MTRSTRARRARIAVVGSGVSGLTAAYVLRTDHDVTLFESQDRLGGHAHTHEVASGSAQVNIDSGFIVHNDRGYPYLRRLFRELDVDVRPTEMSMSIRCDGCGLEYAGGRGPKGIFAQRRRLVDPRYLALLLAVRRFQKEASALLDLPADEGNRLTYGAFLRQHSFSNYFISHYAIPVVSCVWSSGHEDALAYPAHYLFTFLRHHGFLELGGAPQWFTVKGGSQEYVRKVAKAVGDVRTSSAVTSVARNDDSVLVTDEHGETHTFDRVVIATHADDALALLHEPTVDERRVLGAFAYSRNDTVLHRDHSLLPDAAQARSSWNYRLGHCTERRAATTVTYWMNRLQGLDTTEQFLVTLNPTETIGADQVVASMEYTHPIYTTRSVAAQAELPGLSNARTAFAGAYHGWGFHEDGCRSGVEAARMVGGTW